MKIIDKIPTVEELKAKMPLSADLAAERDRQRKEICRVLSGASQRLLLIVGPCSADNKVATIEYVTRLARLQEQIKEHAIIIPRVYTCKPRTTGDGYKGMLHQPVLTEEENIVKGLAAVRDLHLSVAQETGLFSADEMLYPELMEYLQDLLAYTAVGARSVENQQHRLVASGLDMPVAMKNPMNGDIHVMLNSIQSAQHPHHFIYNGNEVLSEGNMYAHAIMRGYLDKDGQAQPNYHYETLLHLYTNYVARGLHNMAVIVDCNHHNSNKQYEEQIRIAQEVMQLRKYNNKLKTMIKGLMLESYICDGRQNFPGKVFGQSLTDACLGWDKTERLINDIVNGIV